MKNPLERPSKKAIGERVRALRIRRGKTQVELSKQLGMNQSNLSEVERGVRGLTVQQLMKVSKALSASSDEILFGVSGKRETDQLSLKILRRVQRIQTLPPAKQRAVLEILDALVDKKSRDNGAG